MDLTEPMNTKLRQIMKSFAKSLLILSGFLLYVIIDKDSTAFLAAVTFIAPYYLFWLIVMMISVINRGESFNIIWIGSLSDDETFIQSNLPYAIAFFAGILIILAVQVSFRYVVFT